MRNAILRNNLKERSSFDCHYPMDQDFFDENKKEDDDKFGDEDFLTESDDPLNTQVHPLETNAGGEDEEYGNGLSEPLECCTSIRKSLDHKQKDNTSSSFTHRDIADEVSTFSYRFRLNHTTKRQKNVIVLEDVDMGMQELWLPLDASVVASMIFSEAGDCEEVRRHQSQYNRGISSLVKSHFNLFLIGSVLREKERMWHTDQLFELLDDTRGSVTSLHARECATCLAADVCNYQCCHDWFLDIGHRLRLIEDEEAGESGSKEDKESKQYPSDANQESIFSYSRREQMDDSCDPLFYGQKSTAKPGK
ncbi:hypothetical protein OS493_028541 [Desmophyllum pertusum]|uniref:Uncharacterized protein n=1 Tax=Desmophyllum pertusum TaxID=174260 RepID=A0A9W9Z9L8_9CNID|nr:hypothetical protein OS493_028541 [Desmophyllum pertusum]